jgi:hypothetical protein
VSVIPATCGGGADAASHILQDGSDDRADPGREAAAIRACIRDADTAEQHACDHCSTAYGRQDLEAGRIFASPALFTGINTSEPRRGFREI